MEYCALFLVAVIGMTLAEPAPDISKLRITNCNCSKCSFQQIGYALRGRVVAMFNGSRVSCSKKAIVNWARTVIGWNYSCSISGSDGKFEVRYGAGRLCGRNYDRVYLNSCSGTPCSNFG